MGAGSQTPPNRPFQHCVALLRAGDPRAAQALDFCLARFPDHAAGWWHLGDVLAELDKGAAALVCYERAHRIDPSSGGALKLGTVLRDLGRAEEARAAFSEAARLDPGSVRAWFLSGVAAQDAGDFAHAAEAYRAALAREPTLAEAELNLGTALQASHRLEDAKAAYARALKLKPDCFGRIAQALSTARTGELWLDLGALRRALDG